MFFQSMYLKLKKSPKRIAFADGTDPTVMKAAAMYAKSGFGTPFLVGSPAKIEEAAERAKVSLKGISIIPVPYPTDEDFAKQYYEMRKEKGMTLEQARELVKQPHYVAVMCLKHGIVDGVVSGYHSETKPFLPAFHMIGTKPGISKASSYFIMTKATGSSEKVYFFADCGLQIQPNADELADIATLTSDTAKSFGISPMAALLSFSTHGSAKAPEVEKIQNAVRIANQKRPDLTIEGEMQFDAATIPEICGKKFPDSKIMGRANVLIFPDLDAGNISYKITERLGGFHAVGPLLQGLNKPVQDLSRGASVQDILDSAVVCAMQAQAGK